MGKSIDAIFSKQRAASLLLRSESIGKRKERLAILKKWIVSNREQLQASASADMDKPPVEFYSIELLHVINEINLGVKKLDEWVKSVKVDAPIYMLGTRSVIAYEPLGVCLIIAPWNYPFSLCIGPLVSALAAGNTVVIKPSEFTPAVSNMIATMINELYDESIVAVVEGDAAVSGALLKLPFDHIFFTGSPTIGKVVMRAAAENLSSVTLELGGKSPAIVLKDAAIKEAAKRIVVGKFINAGQTCIAPDYVMVHSAIANELTVEIGKQVKELFIDNGKTLEHTKIVSNKHFDRLLALIEEAEATGGVVNYSGNHDKEKRFIHPTVISNASVDSKILQEEIFGPILPIITFDTLQQVTGFVNSKSKPLSLYIFSTSKKDQDYLLNNTTAGGVCINDCAIHFLHGNLPFGGVNSSGIGKAHGRFGFISFSNEKPILRQRHGLTSAETLYPPYTTTKKKIIDWLLRFF